MTPLGVYIRDPQRGCESVNFEGAGSGVPGPPHWPTPAAPG